MKRDMELVRKILDKIEAESNPNIIEIDGYEQSVTSHHVRILQDAGFIVQEGQRPFPPWLRLTWYGHDYLENIRSE